MAKDVVSDFLQRMPVLSPDEPCADQVIKKIDCNQRRCFLIQMSQKTYDYLCLRLGNSHKADCWLSSRIEEVDALPDRGGGCLAGSHGRGLFAHHGALFVGIGWPMTKVKGPP